MRIAIDAMGGDLAPAAPVEGALQALAQYDDVEVVLVGDPAALEAELAKHGAAPSERIMLHDAPEKVDTADPVRSIRGSDKVSARACAELLHKGDVEGVLTMGTTGGAVAAATLYCRRLKGVKRTGIAVPLPNPNGVSVMIDGGANPDARPNEVYQYAVMALHYAKASLGIPEPRIGILSIGEEETKGNRLVADVWEQFRANPLPGFIGNVEPHAVFEGAADVVVCDGFTGNIVLKAAEGLAAYMLHAVPGILAKIGADSVDPRMVIGGLAKTVDYAAYGGAPLLGVKGAYVIGHGRSGPKAYLNGARVIRSYVQGGVGALIEKQLAGIAASDAAKAAASSEAASSEAASSSTDDSGAGA